MGVELKSGRIVDATLDRYRVKPGKRFSIADFDPADRSEHSKKGKEADTAALVKLQGRLDVLQDVLYAQAKHRILLVLQGTDTSGKDGTIRHVFKDVNPMGLRTQSFKKPTEPELARDYLWRAHAHVPADGELVVFNRSHYEDVLVLRVHGTIDDERAEQRFAHIRDFERMLVEEGTTIVKVFLHISEEEQAERLQSRLDRPDKHWKFSSADVEERAFWADYQRVYQDAIGATSTEQAPWYVVPADRKWYRNLAVSSILVETLERLDMSFPDPEEGLEDVVLD